MEPPFAGCGRSVSLEASFPSNKPQAKAVELAQLGGEGLLRGTSCNVINLKRLLNGKQNVWKYQNGEEKSDSDGREKDV